MIINNIKYSNKACGQALFLYWILLLCIGVEDKLKRLFHNGIFKKTKEVDVD